MGQITYRANLSAKSFPFLAKNWGRTVIVPQYDNAFNRQVTSQEDSDKDIGIPQIYYCHNVMPTQQGFQSVGYETFWKAPNIPAAFVDIIDSGPGSTLYFGQTDTGAVYINVNAVWTYLASFPMPYVMTQAVVNGVQYIYLSGIGCYTYNFTTGLLDPVTLTALVPTAIKGITAAAGYMIAWSAKASYWSSTIDPTDFVPSLISGAGGGQIEASKGDIIFCAAHTLGFIVYTEANVVIALYSGNARYPFNFREIVNSGGVSDAGQITYDARSGGQYVYSTSGLQLVLATQTKTVFPEVTDFLAGQLLEDYDEVLDVFITTEVAGHLLTRLSMVSDRYLILSYGIISLTHAVVYDLTTNRWGKLKIPHVACFEYFVPTAIVTETPRKSMAFLQKDGILKIVSFDVNYVDSSGVICLGKYQFVRARMMQLNEIHLENIPNAAATQVKLLTALDGKNTANSSPVLLDKSGVYRHYGCRATGVNHSLVVRGAFALDSVVLVFNIHGKR